MRWLWLGVVAGCGGTVTEVEISPSPLDLGTVLFPTEMPEGGYASAEVEIVNVGEEAAELTLLPWEGDREDQERNADQRDEPAVELKVP